MLCWYKRNQQKRIQSDSSISWKQCSKFHNVQLSLECIGHLKYIQNSTLSNRDHIASPIDTSSVCQRSIFWIYLLSWTEKNAFIGMIKTLWNFKKVLLMSKIFENAFHFFKHMFHEFIWISLRENNMTRSKIWSIHSKTSA